MRAVLDKGIGLHLDLADRRSGERLCRTLQLKYCSGSLAYDRGYVINISRTGARIVAQGRLSAGSNLLLDLQLDQREVRIVGEKVWEMPLHERGASVVGVHFRSMQRGDRALFESWWRGNANGAEPIASTFRIREPSPEVEVVEEESETEPIEPKPAPAPNGLLQTVLNWFR